MDILTSTLSRPTVDMTHLEMYAIMDAIKRAAKKGCCKKARQRVNWGSTNLSSNKQEATAQASKQRTETAEPSSLILSVLSLRPLWWSIGTQIGTPRIGEHSTTTKAKAIQNTTVHLAANQGWSIQSKTTFEGEFLPVSYIIHIRYLRATRDISERWIFLHSRRCTWTASLLDWLWLISFSFLLHILSNLPLTQLVACYCYLYFTIFSPSSVLSRNILCIWIRDQVISNQSFANSRNNPRISTYKILSSYNHQHHHHDTLKQGDILLLGQKSWPSLLWWPRPPREFFGGSISGRDWHLGEQRSCTKQSQGCHLQEATSRQSSSSSQRSPPEATVQILGSAPPSLHSRPQEEALSACSQAYPQ